MDLRQHIKYVTLEGAADEKALEAYVGGLFGQPLPSDQPLWDFHVITNLKGRNGCQGAVVGRAHHVIGDGTSLLHLFMDHLV